MRTLFSIIFQQFDMVIKVPLVALLAAGIVLITTRMGIGNRKTRYLFGGILFIAFFATMIAGLVLLTTPTGILLLEICILAFVASIIVFAVSYLIDLNYDHKPRRERAPRARKFKLPKFPKKKN